MAGGISVILVTFFTVFLGSLSNAQLVCVTKPKVSQSGFNSYTSIRIYWKWDSTSPGCLPADKIRITNTLENKDQCQPIASPRPVVLGVNGPDEFVEVDGLLPFSTYNINYSLTLEGNKITNGTGDIQITTATGTLGIPENIRNIDKTATTLSFSWTQVLCGERHANISKYRVLLAKADNPGLITHFIVPVDRLEVAFPGIDPNTEYLFQINPNTEYLFQIQSLADLPDGITVGSNYSEPLKVRTWPNNIPPPTDVAVADYEYDQYQIIFKWCPVNCTMFTDCKKVTGYKYKFVSEDDTDARNGTVQGDVNVILSNLTNCAEYFYQVAAITDNGIGTFSQPLLARLVRLTEPRNLRAPHADLYNIAIDWEPPYLPGICADLNISGYKIEYGREDLVQRSEVSVPDIYRYELTNLTGHGTYTIRIKAVGEEGQESKWSQTIKRVTEEGVSSEPQNVLATKVTSDSITLEWAPPLYPNGDIKYYDIRLIPAHDNSTSSSTTLVEHTNLKNLVYVFPNLMPQTFYEIRIRANKNESILNGTEASIEVATKDLLPLPIGVIVGTGIGFLLLFNLFIIVACIICCRKYRQSPWSPTEQPRLHRRVFSESVICNPGFERETPRFIPISVSNPPPDSVPDYSTGSYQLPSADYINLLDGSTNPSDWEIGWDDFSIQETILGRGEFGIVREGKIRMGNHWITVAVKNLPDCAGEIEVKNFQNELKIMKKIGRHINVVSLMGYCTYNGVLHVALEHVNRGNLLQYLRDSRVHLDSGPTCALTYVHLISLAVDVAKGMQFLSENEVIHRDLAARNVLVGTRYDGELIAKVCDFGLSKADGVYRQTSNVKIPVKWTAIEALTRQVFTTKSDVWSFGILLWEIVTLGGTPYSTPRPVESRYLPIYLQNHRMDQPENCDNGMYQLMLRCWEGKPASRPTFTEIVRQLEYMLDEDVYVIPSINDFANIDSDDE